MSVEVKILSEELENVTYENGNVGVAVVLSDENHAMRVDNRVSQIRIPMLDITPEVLEGLSRCLSYSISQGAEKQALIFKGGRVGFLATSNDEPMYLS